jgi:hypothetical protein
MHKRLQAADPERSKFTPFLFILKSWTHNTAAGKRLGTLVILKRMLSLIRPLGNMRRKRQKGTLREANDDQEQTEMREKLMRAGKSEMEGKVK